MITDVPMRLDFYKQHVRSPRYFDILMNANGSLAIINPLAIKNGKIVVVLEAAKPVTPSPHQPDDLMESYRAQERFAQHQTETRSCPPAPPDVRVTSYSVIPIPFLTGPSSAECNSE